MPWLPAPVPALLAFGLYAHLSMWYQNVRAPIILIVGDDSDSSTGSGDMVATRTQSKHAHIQSGDTHRHVADIHSVLRQCPALWRAHLPPLLFYTGYLQLVPFIAESWWRETWAPPCVWQEELAECEDGELLSLGWAEGIPQHSETDESPFLIIHHGASGHTTDFPNQTYVKEALKRGWTVCVFNRRGHSRPLTRPNFCFFGSTADVRRVTQRYFRDRRPRAPVFMLGMSAGSGVLARYMGEQGLNALPREEIEGFCTAAIGVSPGYDIEKCFARVKYPFDSILMKSGKAFFLDNNTEVLQDCESYRACKNAENIQEWYVTAILCHAMPCYDMLWYAMLCYALLKIVVFCLPLSHSCLL
jgi:predicted alpha/beta-fold hydrolase